MHIVIMGAGKAGYALAYKLIEEDKAVSLIERDPKKACYADDNLDCLVITDDGSNPAVLRDAGIAKAEYFVALNESDEINMITCALVSAEFPKTQTIARIRNSNYSQSSLIAGSPLRIDHIITELTAADRIIHSIEIGAHSEVLKFDNSRFQIRDISIEPNSPLNGLNLAEISPDIPDDFLAVAILRDEKYFIPREATRIQTNDLVYILSSQESFEQICILAE